MKEITIEEAKQIITKGTYLLEFTTTWCGDCKMMQPVVEEVEKKLKKVSAITDVLQVDAEKAQLFRSDSEFQVLKVPSFYKVVNGVKTHLGYEYVPASKLIDAFLDK